MDVMTRLTERNSKIYKRIFQGHRGRWKDYVNKCLNKDFRLSESEEVIMKIRKKKNELKNIEDEIFGLQKKLESLPEKQKIEYTEVRD